MRRMLLGLSAVLLGAMPVRAETVLKIGFVNTFTGGGAVIGKQQRAGFDLALERRDTATIAALLKVEELPGA